MNIEHRLDPQSVRAAVLVSLVLLPPRVIMLKYLELRPFQGHVGATTVSVEGHGCGRNADEYQRGDS